MLPHAPRTPARSPSASWFHLSRSLSLLVHTSTTFELDSITRNLPEDLSTRTAQHYEMLPLSTTCPADRIDVCKPVVVGAIWKSPDTLAPSRLRIKICVQLLEVGRCPDQEFVVACFTIRHREHPFRGVDRCSRFPEMQCLSRSWERESWRGSFHHQSFFM